MPPSNPPFPLAAHPKRPTFDPWNSSSTGHQRAENRLAGSTHWRTSRTAKLAVQFRAGPGGGARVADSVGAGSEGFDKGERTANGGWKRGVVPLEQRGGGQRQVGDFFGDATGGDEEGGDWAGVPPSAQPLRESSSPLVERAAATAAGDGGEREGAPRRVSLPSSPSALLPAPSPIYAAPASSGPKDALPPPSPAAAAAAAAAPPQQIFANLTVHINGSTYPLVSDHKLKHLLVTHGAALSLTPARRSVTHVILGRTNVAGGRGGAGGGLAAGKIQKEIARTRSGGNAVRFVTAEWVLESVRVGKRVSEARFAVVANRPAGVRAFCLPDSKSEEHREGEV